jgi:hypothetical protein
MFEQLEELRAQLHALPTCELDQLDQLDTRARTLAEQHERLRDELDRLPGPRRLCLTRHGDPHLVDRTRLLSSIEGVRTQLDRTLAERTALARRLGDPRAVREERDGLINAAQANCDERSRNSATSSPTATRHQPRLGPRNTRRTTEHGWQRE